MKKTILLIYGKVMENATTFVQLLRESGVIQGGK